MKRSILGCLLFFSAIPLHCGFKLPSFSKWNTSTITKISSQLAELQPLIHNDYLATEIQRNHWFPIGEANIMPWLQDDIEFFSQHGNKKSIDKETKEQLLATFQNIVRLLSIFKNKFNQHIEEIDPQSLLKDFLKPSTKPQEFTRTKLEHFWNYYSRIIDSLIKLNGKYK